MDFRIKILTPKSSVLKKSKFRLRTFLNLGKTLCTHFLMENDIFVFRQDFCFTTINTQTCPMQCLQCFCVKRLPISCYNVQLRLAVAKQHFANAILQNCNDSSRPFAMIFSPEHSLGFHFISLLLKMQTLSN